VKTSVLMTCVLMVVAATVRADEPGPVRLLLPPVIYATPGIECNVYLRNTVLVLDMDDYAFDVRCDQGRQWRERWTYTPEAGEAGDYPITIRVFDGQNKLLAEASSVVRVTPAEAGAADPVGVLLVGASLTQASVYPRHLLDLAEADGHVTIKLIGSRGPDNKPADGPVRHEGYNGWSAQSFVTHHGPLSRTGEYKRPDTGSPFIYEDAPGKLTLDFQRYYDQFNTGRAPNFITIQLGPNDIFRDTDETIDAGIDKALGYYDQLIAKIHEADASTHVGVILVAPASPSQDGFRNYRGTGKQTAWQYRRNHHRLIERMIERYAGRTDERIHLVPVNVAVDTDHHYPTWTAARDARSDEKVTRVNNGTHPSDAGYRQVGDVIYAWIKATLHQPSGTE